MRHVYYILACLMACLCLTSSLPQLVHRAVIRPSWYYPVQTEVRTVVQRDIDDDDDIDDSSELIQFPTYEYRYRGRGGYHGMGGYGTGFFHRRNTK